MPRLSIELIKTEFRNFKGETKIEHFGPYMNEKFFLGDHKLQAELDNNMAMLRLLKDHVQKEE
tara:strand:+ start:1484 stop:1672 length:189 start_codon:yes stop_codon:yes gene_type:complete